MKIRTFRYIIKEGFLNTYRNKLMTLASVSIVSASLLIFGIFVLLSINLSQSTRVLVEQPEIKVFCKPEYDDTQIGIIAGQIRNNDKIKEYRIISKQEAFELAKQMVDNKEDILEGFDGSFLPVSFNIKVKDPKDSDSVVEYLKGINGVYKVKYSQETVEAILKVSGWVKVISGILIVILLIVSVFIISNTIKLTVFARSKEISIMKYIGATDWFIRWPFIIEGVVIGFIGAIAAFVLIGYSYSSIATRFNSEINFIRFVTMEEIGFQIIWIYCIIGVVVGAVGSVMSLRKYLQV